MPFSALAGIDVNGDAQQHRLRAGHDAERRSTAGSDAEMLAAVNAWRASTADALNPAAAAQPNRRSTPTSSISVDLRVTKAFALRQPPAGRGHRAGVQPAEQDEPAAGVDDQRPVECVRDDQLGVQHAAGGGGGPVRLVEER